MRETVDDDADDAGRHGHVAQQAGEHEVPVQSATPG